MECFRVLPVVRCNRNICNAQHDVKFYVAVQDRVIPGRAVNPAVTIGLLRLKGWGAAPPVRLKDAQKRGDAVSRRGETEACLAEPVSKAP